MNFYGNHDAVPTATAGIQYLETTPELSQLSAIAESSGWKAARLNNLNPHQVYTLWAPSNTALQKSGWGDVFKDYVARMKTGDSNAKETLHGMLDMHLSQGAVTGLDAFHTPQYVDPQKPVSVQLYTSLATANSETQAPYRIAVFPHGETAPSGSAYPRIHMLSDSHKFEFPNVNVSETVAPLNIPSNNLHVVHIDNVFANRTPASSSSSSFRAADKEMHHHHTSSSSSATPFV